MANVRTGTCVNCNLATRADQKQCQHYDPKFGNHPWATKAKLREPQPTSSTFARVGKTYPRGGDPLSRVV